MFKPEEIRNDFPILRRTVNGKSLVYLDSAATSQKPQVVIDAISDYYRKNNANVHRGAHTLGDESTLILEESREAVARFIGAPDLDEVIFVRNTTEAINLVAYAWGDAHLGSRDTVVVCEMDHHSNIVPWQQVAKRTGCRLVFVGVTDEGLIAMEDFKKKVRGSSLVSICHVSNALGTISPVGELVQLAHREGAIVLVDGAQAVPHLPVDVSRLGCDFYAFSGHKMLGPMGIGVLWGKRKLLEQMEPFLTGGGMIGEVRKEGSTWAALPDKFEAGTPNVAGAYGLASAVSYLNELGMENVRARDKEIVAYCLEKLAEIPTITLLGPRDAAVRSGSVSFVHTRVHAHDVATILDSQGVAVRSGHHCTMPLHLRLDVAASVRASFNVYTTRADIDALVKAFSAVEDILGGGR